MIAHLLASYKTTSAGLATILTAIIHLIFQVRAHTADENAWTVALLAVLGGLGLMFAGDASQSKPVDKFTLPELPTLPTTTTTPPPTIP